MSNYNKIKIELYTCGYNEAFQLQFAIDYWKLLITDESELHVTYFDNMSTDNTLDILSKYDWITVKQFDTNGEMNEQVLTNIRNNCWKGSNADWCIVVDVDEVFYSKDLIGELKKMKEQGIGAVACNWYALCGDDVPTYKEGVLLHQQIKKAYKQRINHREGFSDYGKIQLFNPKLAIDMHYSMGMHYAFPHCPIVYNPNIIQIHFDKGYGYQWKIQKRRELWKRLTPTLRDRGVCIEYGWEEEKIKQEYLENQAKSFDINDRHNNN